MKNKTKEILISSLIIVGCFYLVKSITITTHVEKVSVIKRKVPKKRKVDTIKVIVTMYNAVVNQCDSDPLVTAGMFKINPNKASEHKWIAMSRDLLKRWNGKFDYGDKVKLIGADFKDGIYTIVDCMNKRFTKRIDILETIGTKHYKFENVKIIKI